jgi:hypothetical protein
MNDDVEFWQTRYLAGKTPWDFNGVPSALKRWLASWQSPGCALVPGCGVGYEVKAFHDAGWDVIGIDYTPAAVARAQRNLGMLGKKVVLGNFFTHDFAGKRFDVIYERTFLCSMPPVHWRAYVHRMRELLNEKGQLAGLFLFGNEDDPPPYPLTKEAQDALFGEAFLLVADELVSDSLPLFAGRERWQIWEKKPA